MDWKQQFKVHDRSFRKICIILLLLAFNLLILVFILPSQWDSETASAAACAGHQRWIYRIMSEFLDEEGLELPPEWTVTDLIREAVRKNRRSSHPLPKEEFICRNVRYVRVFPYLRRMRTEVDAPYLVFPVPASAVFDESLQQPVTILMCPPGAHGDKRGSMVLYSDGSTISLSREEAEELVAKYSPVPLEIDFEALAEEEQTP